MNDKTIIEISERYNLDPKRFKTIVSKIKSKSVTDFVNELNKHAPNLTLKTRDVIKLIY